MNRLSLRGHSNVLTFLLALLSGAMVSALLMGAGAYVYKTGAGGAENGLQLAQYKGDIKVVSPESGNAVVWAVRKAAPAAVSIETRFGARRGGMMSPLRDFFDTPPEGESRGSGVIIDGKRGYVLTNAHVVKDATAIICKLNNGRKLRGNVLGADGRSDIAVVKVDGGDLPEATLSTSKNLRIGEWAIAIGNPLGNQHTVTVGVVSAIRDGIDAPEGKRLDHVIQTDASINPGNSGGPLCNIKGEVIGINTAIIPWAQGIGFAIQIDTAKRVADSLITGKLAWVGVTVFDAAPRSALALASEKKGAVVKHVEKNSPAQAAGVRESDVILEIDHKPMSGSGEVVGTISAHKPGDVVTLVVQRQGREIKHLKVVIGTMPKEVREKL